MSVEIKNTSGVVIFTSQADSLVAAITEAINKGANLYGANLSGANLSSANLRGANLGGAYLGGAKLPSPAMVLLAQWGSLSDGLTADLMLLDRDNHPDPGAFDAWSKGGPCPYTDAIVQRAANFYEKRELWGKGKPCRPYDLMRRVLAEKCPDWSDEKISEFQKGFSNVK